MSSGANGKERLKLLLVVAVFAAPVVAAYLFYYVWPPRPAATNYGELIAPVTLSGGVLSDLDGRPVPLSSLRGKWLLVHAAPAPCAAACRRQLSVLSRVRLLQGREQDRVRVLWLVTGVKTPEPMAGDELRGLTVLWDQSGALVRQFPAPGDPAAHLYIVDPLGNVMMRYGLDPDIKRMGQDLGRLLRASQIG